MTESERPTGLVFEMDDDDYFGDPGIGASKLRRYHNASLRHAETPPEPSDSLRLGTLVHRAVLEPEQWKKHLNAEPPHDFDNWRHESAAKGLARYEHPHVIADRCNVQESTARKYMELEAIQQQANHYRNHNPDDAVDPDTADEVESIRDSVREYLEAARADAVIDAADAEVAMFWDDAATDERCRGKLDAFADTGGGSSIVVDLKTTHRTLGNDAHTFEQLLGRKAYHLQTGHYATGLERLGWDVDRWLWLVVETDEPYGVRLFELQDDLEEAKRTAQHAVQEYVDDRESDGYDGYEPEITTVEVPGWA